MIFMEVNGSIGEFCERIDMLQPKIDKQRDARLAHPASDPRVIAAIEHTLSEISEIQKELGCERLASG